MEEITTIGLDIAKFGVDLCEGEAKSGGGGWRHVNDYPGPRARGARARSP